MRLSNLHKKDVLILVNLFWERFYNLCVARGTRPNPVAKEIDVSSGAVTKWKTLGTLPSGETLIKLADYLDCSVDYLLGRTDAIEVNRRLVSAADSERILAEVLEDVDEQRQINELIQTLKSKNSAQEPAPEFVKQAKTLLGIK